MKDSNTPTLKWVEEVPPSTRHIKSKWLPVVEELKKNPGKWALILESSASTGSLHNVIIRGRTSAWQPKGAFEAAQRSKGKNEEGKPIADLYVRYIGESTEKD